MLSNVRHESFAQAFAVTGNASEAWRRATGRIANADVHGPKWMGKAGISERIAEIRREIAQAGEKSKQDLTRWLGSVIDGRESATAIQLRAAELLSRMCGFHEAEKVSATVTHDLSVEDFRSDPGAVAAMVRQLSELPHGRKAMEEAMMEREGEKKTGR